MLGQHVLPLLPPDRVARARRKRPSAETPSLPSASAAPRQLTTDGGQGPSHRVRASRESSLRVLQPLSVAGNPKEPPERGNLEKTQLQFLIQHTFSSTGSMWAEATSCYRPQVCARKHTPMHTHTHTQDDGAPGPCRQHRPLLDDDPTRQEPSKDSSSVLFSGCSR